jgi:Na+-driven multidrug efflux pump
MAVQTATLILHLLWCYIFIQVCGLREYGAAIATNITYILNMILCDELLKRD